MGSLAEGELKQPQGQLLVHAIDEKAQWIPDHMYMRYALKDWEQAGYQVITWRQYANAINKVAYWFDEKFGKASTCDTVAYFGPNDPRYAILIPAIIKNGRKLLVPDGRITEEGLDGLVESTNCRVWLYAEDDAGGSLVKSKPGLDIHALPTLHWMLDNEGQKRYPYEKTYEEAEWDEIIIIHTSGTTGVPRPIYHTNGMWAAYKNVPVLNKRHWPRGLAYESWFGKTNLNPCPPQWLAGLHAMIVSPVFLDSPCIMLPQGEVSLTPRTFKKILQMNQIDGMRCPPYTITTLYDDPASKKLLRSLEFVVYLGAPLNQAIGDDLCQYTRLSPAIGSTETGDQLSLRPANRKLWYTHDFVPENGHKMVPLDIPGEDLHELVLEAPKDGRMNPFQLAFWNTAHRHLDRIETKELYRPVTDSDARTRWEFSARKDDLTKLNWLAKFNAQDIEKRILLHSDVEQVLVGGEGRPTPYIIMQAKVGVLDRKSEAQLLEELYEHIVTGTNKADIDEIRIPKETLLLAKKEKPFQVNLKQVVQRRAVEQDYLGEIEQAYMRLENERKSSLV
ncbi:Acs Acyl-coenzyme A synthetase AMP- fatty acid ligase [Pyrenophora tritici-repentis]|uniref:Acs, Acyl-coenzyme A synthetase-AMP-(Fatty) acid ligase n=2 Tax=Pyrenophora tritici-repentis TaxID=45151 RepID=A0A2W1DAU8_9PLEO|nr:NRPS-like enzyme [Pyrenophora tritici-repentis]KAF7443795.1 NRPS enzyme [Pyrenophora tritici-repentis]KAF7566481.1 Acs, Acyl-coenzyme A synthetase-AMP-(fatty) acid ligase [Pyrenophora tritici-repentis]KAG9379531.1 NRPS enzyme [Pyrenophora tritici-repentis]KAI0572676.1 NRPS-like enzyme [Pyrenophora tritici-repentis]